MSDQAGAGRAPVVGEVARLVPPRHCDAQGMMHASRPAEYFEDALIAWLDLVCAGYGNLRAAGVDLVIVESTIRYLVSARLGDEVSATATPIERGRTSLRISFELIRAGELLVAASTTYVCGGPAGPVEIPDLLAAALAPVPVRTRGQVSARLQNDDGITGDSDGQPLQASNDEVKRGKRPSGGLDWG